MDCPICKTSQLVMSERQGIEIDYCPSCRGVWLDRGELDKIIDRAGGSPQGQPQQQMPPQRQETPPIYPAPQHHAPSREHYPQGYAPQQQGYYKKKKREGFLGELFDFD